MKRKTLVAVMLMLLLGCSLRGAGFAASSDCDEPAFRVSEQKRVEDWKRNRDDFFKNHYRSPLPPQEKKAFVSLKYFPFDPKYIFCGPLERYRFNSNNPRYYATFLTNKGTQKRYIRYGRFHFRLDGQDYSIEVYKSILSDALFIPFKDRTNGKETYEGGRYIDGEILPGYRMILDFNLAYFPSCAYNDKFVCPIPPKENELNVEIRAGERNLK